MSGEKKTVKLQFASGQESPTLEIANGEYKRTFDAKDQPFECEPEVAAMLRRSGHFVKVPEAESEGQGAKGKAPAEESKAQRAKSEAESVPPASAGGSKRPANGTSDGATAGASKEQSAKS